MLVLAGLLFGIEEDDAAWTSVWFCFWLGLAGLVVMWIKEHLVDRAELVHVEKVDVAVI